VTKATLLTRLRELLAGEHGDAETAEAERLLAELEAERRAAVKSPAAAVVEADDEAARWQRTLHRIGRGGGSMSRVIGGPSGSGSGRTAHTNGLLRDGFSPWR
jgi:hypothetical protein